VADLDPIIQELILNASEFIADMDDVIHLMQDARDTSVSLDAAIGVLEEALSSANDALNSLREGFAAVAGGEDEMMGRSAELEGVIATLRDGIDALRDIQLEEAAASEFEAHAIKNMGEASLEAAGMVAAADAAMKDARDSSAAWMIAATALDKALVNANNAAASMIPTDEELGRAAGTATGFWARWGTVIHWVIAGGFEFLAVFVPAMYAMAAAMTVASDAAGFVYTHFKAMYITQQATNTIFGDTINTMLGLKDVMQQAQDAADPKVYELLGAAINIVSHNSKQFLDVGLSTMSMLDDFAAKLSGEMTDRMSTLNSLLRNGARDLALFGAVIGNVVHAILNLANAAPGLADVLLLILAGITYLIKAFTDLPARILTTLFVLEEFSRWGGLVNNILAKMTGQTITANRGFTSFFFNIGNTAKNMVGIVTGAFTGVITALGNLTLKAGSAMTAIAFEGEEMDAVGMEALSLGITLDTAGASMLAFAAEARAAIAALTPFQAFLIVLAAAGLGFLIYKLATAKDAIQQWAAATNAALASTSDLNMIPKLADDIAQADIKMAAAQKQAATATNAFNAAAEHGGKYGAMLLAGAAQTATRNVSQLQSELQYLDQAQQNLLVNAGNVARTYGTTFVGALELAQSAGVNLTDTINWQSKSADIDRLKIANYITGLEAMGQSAGAVGHDVTLLGIDSELTSDKVQQLNQAIDSFVSGITGGTAGMGALAQSILNIGQATATTTGTISDARDGINQSLSQIQTDLTNFGDIGSQVWQNFDNALSGSAEQLADWFRTAGTEGAIGAPQFTKAMEDIVAQFIPFAKDSSAAQQELVGFAQAQGLNINTFPQLEALVKSTGAGAKDLGKQVDSTTKSMTDMNAVAQSLGASVGTDLVADLNSARIAASQLGQSAEDLATDWFKVHTVNTTVESDFQKVFQSLYDVYHNTGMAESAADAYARSLGMSAKQVQLLNNYIMGLITSLSKIPRNVYSTINIATDYSTIGSAGTAPLGGSGPGHPLGSPGTAGSEASGASMSTSAVVVHVHGSVVSEQALSRAVQTGLNQKTVRNGSTQLFISGRKH
jgi:hypothetical protein